MIPRGRSNSVCSLDMGKAQLEWVPVGPYLGRVWCGLLLLFDPVFDDCFEVAEGINVDTCDEVISFVKDLVNFATVL